MSILLTRRTLLLAGLSAAFVSAIPSIALADDFSGFERSEIGPGALPKKPYKPEVTGPASSQIYDALTAFAETAIAAWGFKDPPNRTDISTYASKQLPALLDLKTTTQGEDSYLTEYENAATIWNQAVQRLGGAEAAFAHVLFACRADKSLNAPRLTRARTLVFDELVRHMVSRGGFYIFGFTNFEGFQGGLPEIPGTYRRSKI